MNLFVQSLTPNQIGAFAGHPLFMPLIIIDLVLRGFALYKAAKANQPVWFVALLLVNSVGILPTIYLLFFAPKAGVQTSTGSNTPKASSKAATATKKTSSRAKKK